MKSSDVDRLLTLIAAERVALMDLDDATVHFIAGGFYALDRAEQLVRKVNVEAPTCLIHCRQEEPE